MANDYKSYYETLPSNEEGNKNMDSFSNAFSGDLSVDDRIRVATGDQDNVIIASDAEKSVVVLHSFHNLGGTVRRPEDKIVAAVGMGANPTGIVIAKTSIIRDIR